MVIYYLLGEGFKLFKLLKDREKMMRFLSIFTFFFSLPLPMSFDLMTNLPNFSSDKEMKVKGDLFLIFSLKKHKPKETWFC